MLRLWSLKASTLDAPPTLGLGRAPEKQGVSGLAHCNSSPQGRGTQGSSCPKWVRRVGLPLRSRVFRGAVTRGYLATCPPTPHRTPHSSGCPPAGLPLLRMVSELRSCLRGGGMHRYRKLRAPVVQDFVAPVRRCEWVSQCFYGLSQAWASEGPWNPRPPKNLCTCALGQPASVGLPRSTCSPLSKGNL